MRITKKYSLFLPLLIGVLVVGCEKKEEEVGPVMPSELSLQVEQNEENPGQVRLNFSAENAGFYKVFFGEEPAELPQVTSEETLSHTYSSSGTYTVRVQAHATESLFVSASEHITVTLADNGSGEVEIPTAGYTTPESYEGMQLVWQDEFSGTELNQNDWTFETGTGSNGWGNNELQYYRKENTTLEDGYLIITAKEENYQGRQYTSSRIITQGKQSFQYGRIDIRAALPQGQGIWPALWMLGSNFSTVGWPACGEIDIMEMIGGGAGRDNTVHGTVHWSHGGDYASYGQGYELEEGIFADEFHVFSIVWDATSISWYVDDVEFNRIDITPEELSEFRQEFFFIFNVAVGGNWPGSPNEGTHFPQRMIVDYVRVFQVE